MNENYFAVPSQEQFLSVEDNITPGQIIFGGGDIRINLGRKAVKLKVINTGDRPIQVFIFDL